MRCLVYFSILFFFLSLLRIAVADATAASASTDTIHLLGGPGRWDGRFETAGGQPNWHLWSHADLHSQGDIVWQVSDFQAEGLGDHGPGNLAVWCGTMFANPCGPGYGNNWNGRLVWAGSVPNPAATTDLQITARLNVDTEAGYDFVTLEVWQDDSWQILESWDGLGSNLLVDVFVTLKPGDYGGPSGDQALLAWHVQSDGGWSDEDCLFDTDGACQIDDVAISMGAELVFADDFQDGDLAGWEQEAGYIVGDFTQLWSGLQDLDPVQENPSWQVAFIDDGEIVPGTGGTPCVNWCYGPEGWVFNVTAGLDGHGVPSGPFFQHNTGVWNGVISPPLAWPLSPTRDDLPSTSTPTCRPIPVDSPATAGRCERQRVICQVTWRVSCGSRPVGRSLIPRTCRLGRATTG